MNQDNSEKIDLYINAKGVPCPIPSMRVRLNMVKLPEGGIMKVVTDNSHSKNSIPRFCRNFGHEIIFFQEENGVNTFIIRKSGLKDKE